MYYGYGYGFNHKGDGGIAPVNTVAPVISGTNTVGSTLSCTTGTWTGVPAPTYAYQWKRGGVDIGGATSSTYTLVSADGSTNITCTVTATNVKGSASATSNTMVALDADAATYINVNTSITSDADKLAVSTFYTTLKSAGVYTKVNRMYIPIWANATLNKWNIKNPVDTDLAGRLTYAGGWNHSSTGLIGNGSNSYANTYLKPNFTTVDDIHFSVYIGNNTQTGYDMGCSADLDGVDDEYILISRYTNGKAYYSADNGYAINVTQADSKGFTLGTYNASNHRLYKNGTEIGSSALTGANTSAYNIVFGGLNAQGTVKFFTDHNYRFVSIGGALSAAEQSSFYTAVNTLLTHFGLNV